MVGIWPVYTGIAFYVDFNNKMPRLFLLAKDAAKNSDHHAHPIGCVLVKGNKPVGIGWNTNKSHPYCGQYTTHAEIKALVSCRSERVDEAYLYRETADGKMANSKPCISCAKALLASGIRRVYYTTSTGFESLRIA